MAQQAGVLGGTYTGAPEYMTFWGAPSDAFPLSVYYIITEITYIKYQDFNKGGINIEVRTLCSMVHYTYFW